MCVSKELKENRYYYVERSWTNTLLFDKLLNCVAEKCNVLDFVCDRFYFVQVLEIDVYKKCYNFRYSNEDIESYFTKLTLEEFEKLVLDSKIITNQLYPIY